MSPSSLSLREFLRAIFSKKPQWAVLNIVHPVNGVSRKDDFDPFFLEKSVRDRIVGRDGEYYAIHRDEKGEDGYQLCDKETWERVRSDIELLSQGFEAAQAYLPMVRVAIRDKLGNEAGAFSYNPNTNQGVISMERAKSDYHAILLGNGFALSTKLSQRDRETFARWACIGVNFWREEQVERFGHAFIQYVRNHVEWAKPHLVDSVGPYIGEIPPSEVFDVFARTLQANEMAVPRMETLKEMGIL